ncbi:GtrA family protein [Ureibacillus manganicus]|uniref:Polysaccharide biosynthesis protein GtrA n=1 Tax=Ureibacillus manganicus DSM 26584 TaxID=1384049 RepID=A0A0A3I4U2_9BACL|nr:GtrA family protein [Ureibacillus manganicus]KGR78545.1 polysaccharide biosynthesis protein GtrA [Ureibacillus manganicus DSM 26584]
MKWTIDPSFYRFIIVGVINTLVGTSIMFLAYNLFHLSYWVSSFLNYFIGSIVSYFLNKYFTFRQKDKSLKEIILFVVNIAVCYVAAYYLAAKIISVLLVDYSMNIKDNISLIVGMILFVLLNYFGQRFFVFTRKE